MATLIRTDGSEKLVVPENGKDFRLPQLYELLSCKLVEIITLQDDEIMILDEEGKLDKTKHLNASATARAFRDNAISLDDFIIGDVLICSTTELK